MENSRGNFSPDGWEFPLRRWRVWSVVVVSILSHMSNECWKCLYSSFGTALLLHFLLLFGKLKSEFNLTAWFLTAFFPSTTTTKVSQGFYICKAHLNNLNAKVTFKTDYPSVAELQHILITLLFILAPVSFSGVKMKFLELDDSIGRFRFSQSCLGLVGCLCVCYAVWTPYWVKDRGLWTEWNATESDQTNPKDDIGINGEPNASLTPLCSQQISYLS